MTNEAKRILAPSSNVRFVSDKSRGQLSDETHGFNSEIAGPRNVARKSWFPDQALNNLFATYH